MKLALVPLNPTVGDLDGNAAKMTAFAEQARAAGADVVVFPELALCGYPPKDLLLQRAFIAAMGTVADRFGEGSSRGLTVIFGLALPRADAAAGLTNSLLVYRDGWRVARYDKRLLPTYDVFDEDRYFTPGDRAVVIDLPAPGGPVRAGLAICEDLWKGEDAGFSTRYERASDPVADAANAGATLLISPSASPFVLGKGGKHRGILARHAQRHEFPVLSVNQCGGNDDLVFDGHVLVYDRAGELHACSRGFVDEMLIVDLEALARGTPSLRRALAGPTDLSTASDEEQLFRALVLGTRDYLRKTGFTTAVLGISGGIDSAVTAAIAAAAVGPANVTGLVMPGFYSSEHSKADAIDLANRLGIRAVAVPIDPPVDGFRAVLNPALQTHGHTSLGAKLPDLTEENLQSRARGTILMAWSNRTGAIVLTTGNKSELAVGYCTLYGDMNGGLAVLSDVSKQWVYRLARWMNANHAAAGFSTPPIPASSIDKPPSAELRPNQTDQDTLPPYDVLDRIIELAVEERRSVGEIVARTGYDESLVRRVARMIDLSEYKRKQAATGLKVTSVAFGSGRRMPIAQRWTGG